MDLDKLINWFNSITYGLGFISLGKLMLYKDQLSILFGAIAVFISILTFMMSLFFQFRKDYREGLEEERKAIVFKERRTGEKPDTGERRRENDE